MSGSMAAPPVRSDVEAIERRRQDLGRRGLQIEQQTDRLGEIHVGEVAQHAAVFLAVEQAGQDRALQQVVATVWIELQHRSREPAEHDLRQPRVERGEQHRDVAEFPLECRLPRIDAGNVVIGQSKQHARDVGRILDEDDEIDERDGVERLSGIESDPAFVGRIQIADRARPSS